MSALEAKEKAAKIELKKKKIKLSVSQKSSSWREKHIVPSEEPQQKAKPSGFELTLPFYQPKTSPGCSEDCNMA